MALPVPPILTLALNDMKRQRKRNESIMWSIHISNLNTLVIKATQLKFGFFFVCVFLLISVCRLFFFLVFVFVIVPPALRLLLLLLLFLLLLLLLLLTMSSDYFGMLSKRALQLPKHLKFKLFHHLHLSFSFSIFLFIFVIIFCAINRHGNQGDLKDHLLDLFIVSTFPCHAINLVTAHKLVAATRRNSVDSRQRVNKL